MEASNQQPELRSKLRPVVRSVVRSIGALVLVVAAYYLVPLRGAAEVAILLRVLGTVVALVALVVWQGMAVLRAPHPALRAGGALVVVAAFGTAMFATVYHAISIGDAGAFNEQLDRTGALYFAMATLTTVGYGDIAAVSHAARITVMVHMLVNLAVIGAAARIFTTAAARRRDAAEQAGVTGTSGS